MMKQIFMNLSANRFLFALVAGLCFCDGGFLMAEESQSKENTNPRAVQYRDWTYSGSVWLLTTSDGASIPEGTAVEDFPLLLRLHRDFFDFQQAQTNGADLRFTTSANQPLAYQIEDWDPQRGVAAIWVRVPKIHGNARQEIKIYWGNPNATSESSGKAVFNESNGYLSVWHMNVPVNDDVGTLTSTDTGTSAAAGMIGQARHFPGGEGIFGGDKIPNYPTGANAHSSEVWFRAERPNSTLLAWGIEQAQGKVVMQFRSPPHIQMDCYFSGGNVNGERRVPLGEWTHVIYTYREGESKLYVNGVLDAANLKQGPPLNIHQPARLYVGGWYNNYDFVGDLDEVRVSKVARSADWIKLQFDNQNPNQRLVGPLVQHGDEIAVSSDQVTVGEGQSTTIMAKAGGAQSIVWTLKQHGRETIVATNRFSYTFNAGRVSRPQSTRRNGDVDTSENLSAVLTMTAIYADGPKSKTIPITISDDIPEPHFVLNGPTTWDGRQAIQIVSQITNLAELQSKQADKLNIAWTVDDVAVIKQVEADKLTLKRAQGSGTLKVTAAIDNGGDKIIQSIEIAVKEPAATQDPWNLRTFADNEQPEDNQFFARDQLNPDGTREGLLVYRGTLAAKADSVFVRVFADDKLFATQTCDLANERRHDLSVKLKAGLVKYRTEFGSKTGNVETLLHAASNLVCGDAFLINGQSNAVATDFGKEPGPAPNEWVRTFGSTDGGPEGSRRRLWATAQARGQGGQAEIGYWGMELGRRLVESERIPICIINGAVGGTRIDQHQRNEADPTDVNTIYGRLLWRVHQAKLTHGIRAVFWHQGENDQGADGPTGGYGYETYRQFFVDLAAAWKQDYPNVEHYFVFQIWPKSCAMGINGSDNRLREVQRSLPSLFSNLSVMSTVGVKPPGGCHFPAAGYAEFARLIAPVVEQKIYHRSFDQPITPPNLKRASFTTDRNDQLVLEFDSPVEWSDRLTNQFRLDGEANHIASGSANGTRLVLNLKGATTASKVTYLDSSSWSPENLLYGTNGLAALTFCEVQISPKR